jgi:hypothetical protein
MKTLNQYHSSDLGIDWIHRLDTQMDNDVREAYGWTDIDLRRDCYEVDYLPKNDRVRFTIHPAARAARREVLNRHLPLNHKIHALEVADGLWEKKGKSGKAAKQQAGQMGLEL